MGYSGCPRDEERSYALGFDRDDIVLIFEDAFDHEELRGRKKEAVLLKQIGMNDGVRHSGFVLNTQKNKPFRSEPAGGGQARSEACRSIEAARYALCWR